MIPTDELDHLLHERFTERAQQVTPTTDPGPLILARSARLTTRRRRRQVVAVTTTVAVLVALAVLSLRGPSGPSEVHTADDATTTTVVAGCSVADSCQPASVASMTVGQIPSGYSLSPGPPPATLPGSQVVELVYAPPSETSGSVVVNTGVLDIRVTTTSPSDTSAVVAQAATWAQVPVGARLGRTITSTHTAGTQQATITDLEVQLSPTVVLFLSGEGMTINQLVAVASSITVEP
jgi:hypothetical protein